MKKQNVKPQVISKIISEKQFNFVDLKALALANIPFFVLIAFLIVVLYGNTIIGQFLTADDIPGIVNNPLVKDFAGSMKSLDLERMYPATLIQTLGMNPIPFHLFSISMHILNSILVFLFIYLIFEKKLAVITTLLFVTHPINTEAVSWISAYGYLIYTFINLLMFISFTMYRKTTNKNYFVFSIIVFCLGLIFYRKPWMVVTPVMVVLLDQLILQPKINIKKGLINLWYVLPVGIYAITWLRNLIVSRQTALVDLYYSNTIDPTPYINRILYTTYMTIKLYVYPQALTIYHEGEQVSSMGGFTVLTVIATLGLITLLIYLFKKSRIQEYKVIAASIVFIYTAIVFSYAPQVLVWSMADRYLYFGSIFFCLIVAIILNSLEGKYKNISYILGIILLLYSIKTIWRNFTWQNNKTLWTNTQKVAQYSYRVYNNLGDVASTEGDVESAIKYFQISVQLNPGFADAIHNLGYAYYQKGDIALAKQYFEKSLEMNPRLYQAAYKLGVIAYNEGNYTKAQEYFIKALQIYPQYDLAINGLRVLEQLQK